jgi:serine O-acetyltransferase
MTLKDLLLADLRRQWSAAGSMAVPTSWADVARSLVSHKYLPIVLVRVAGALDRRGYRIGARICSLMNQLLFGVEVALRSEIGPGLYFPHTGGIVLGARHIGTNVTIYHGVTLGAAELDVGYTPGKRPAVGDNVVIAAGAKVLGGISIGEGAVVGANALVVKDVAPRIVVGGVPAVLIRTREAEEQW